MANRTKGRDRIWIWREIKGASYQELLKGLQGQNPFFQRFQSWEGVLIFMHGGSSQDPLKDEVLRPIFAAHTQDQDPRWRSILLAIFWPGLVSIHRKKRHWDTDPEELWQNITWVFLKVVCRVNVEQRPARLAQKVFNDTVHHLCDEYRHRWKRSKVEIPIEDWLLEQNAKKPGEIDYAAIEHRLKQDVEISRLRSHFESGHISEPDFLLLVGTRVYGKSVADYARDMGVDYQAVKKRRQRAEETIRRHEGGL